MTTTTGGNLGLGPSVGTKLFSGNSTRPEGVSDAEWADVQAAVRRGDTAGANTILRKAGVIEGNAIYFESLSQLRKDIKASSGERSSRRGLIKRARSLDRLDLIPQSWGEDLAQATTSTDMGFNVIPGPHGGTRSAGTKGTGDVGGYGEDELRRKQKLTQPGKPLITTQAQLKSAIRDALTAGDKLDPKMAKYITSRAYALGFSTSLPSKGLMAEEARKIEALPKDRDGVHVLAPFLVLEAMGLPAPTILQEVSADNGGRMRIKVPFYVGNSISVAPGFDKRLYFGAELLPGIIQEAKAQIAAKRQPLNVYARHKHAMSGDHLPIGGVVDVEAEGRVGYATIELEPIVPDGVNAMTLIRGKKLNAVSLRSREGQFELEEKRINGEEMYVPTSMAICGVDFAPDSPAMPTYGVEMLAAEARVEDVLPTNRKSQTRRTRVDNEITLESLKSEHSDIVAEIEKPLRKQLADLTQENGELKAAKWQSDKAVLIDTFAGKFGENAAKAKELLQEQCKDAKSAAEVKAAIADVFLLVQEKAAASKTKSENLADLWPVKPAGSGTQPEEIAAEKNGSGDGDLQLEMAAGMPVPAF